ncbi:hypothetical protein VTK73DRAFT_5921 [Phialemonium thermophilum]|uniref:Uncharacterized protein n=1 Tax=Phialemonium thermophilum TaxID=223376 RepID=A0ABR3V0J3_9PEZI
MPKPVARDRGPTYPWGHGRTASSFAIPPGPQPYMTTFGPLSKSGCRAADRGDFSTLRLNDQTCGRLEQPTDETVASGQGGQSHDSLVVWLGLPVVAVSSPSVAHLPSL